VHLYTIDFSDIYCFFISKSIYDFLNLFCSNPQLKIKFSNFSRFSIGVNTDYPAKGEDDYDPRKKLGLVFSKVSEQFASTWIPRQYVSIDEGTILFKGNIHFKVYNHNKPDKHGIRTWMSFVIHQIATHINFDIYAALNNTTPSMYGKMYDHVMRLLDPHKNMGYVAFMDNFYTSRHTFFIIFL